MPPVDDPLQRDEQRPLPGDPPVGSQHVIAVAPYCRTLTTRAVTYRCEWCRQERTELHYPGPAPRYCPGCNLPAQNSMAARRMRAMRERKQPRTGWERGRGRPKT